MATDCTGLTLNEVNKLDEEFEKCFVEAIQKQKCFDSEIKCIDKIHKDIAWSRITKCLERSTNDSVKKWYSLLRSFSDLSKKADIDDDLYFEVMEWPCYKEFQLKMEKYEDLLNSGVSDSNVEKITKTQREILLAELENYCKEIFSVYVSKAQRQKIWNSIAKNVNLIEIGPFFSVIELQKIWLDIKFKTELRERQKLLGTSPEDMRILKICGITSIEECEIMKALESYNEFGVDTDHLKCERCELLNNKSGVLRLCFACSKTNLVICDICSILPSTKVYSTKPWSSAAKDLIPTFIEKDTIWVCNPCKTNLLEQASIKWKVCRLCAKQSSTYIPTNNSFLTQFCKEFSCVFKLKLVFGTGLPSYVCSKCFEKFETIKRFFNDLKKVQVTLGQIHKEKFIGNFAGNYMESGREKVSNKPIGKLTGTNSKSDKDTSKENELIKQDESCLPKLSDCRLENTTLQKIKVKTVTNLNAEILQEVFTTPQTPNSISTLGSTTTNVMCENDLNQSFSMILPNPNYKIFNIRNEHIQPSQIQPQSFVPKRSKISSKGQDVDPSSKTFPAKMVFAKKETDLLQEVPYVDITAQQTPNVTSYDKSKPVKPLYPDICPKLRVNKTIQQTLHSSEKSTQIQNVSYEPSIPSSEEQPNKIKTHEVIKLVNKPLDASLPTQQASKISDSEKRKSPMRQNILYQLKRVTISKNPPISMLVKTGFNIIKEEPEKNLTKSAKNPKYRDVLQRLYGIKTSKRPFSKLKENKATSLKKTETKANLTTEQSPHSSSSQKMTRTPSSLDVSAQPSSPERITASPCPYTPSTDNTVQERELIETKDELDFNTFLMKKSLSPSSPKQNETTSICFDAFDEIKTEENVTPVVQLDSLQSVNTSSNSKHHSNTPFEGLLGETSKNKLFECYLSENQGGKSVSGISRSQQSLVNRPKTHLGSQVFSNPFDMEVDQEKVINPFDASMDCSVEIKNELSETDPLVGAVENGKQFEVRTYSGLYKCEEFIGPPILSDYAVNKGYQKRDKILQGNTCETVKKQIVQPNNLRLHERDNFSSTKKDKNTAGKRENNKTDKPLKLIETFVKSKNDTAKKKKILTSGSSMGTNFESRRSLRKKTTL